MTIRTISLAALWGAALLLGACGSEDDAGQPDAGSATTPAASAPAFLVKEDAPDALAVFDVKGMEAGTEVAVAGRVRDIAKGFAAFTLIDDELDYCGRGDDTMDACVTPWDYCCIQKETQVAASIPVEFRDAAGEPVEADDIGLRLLDLVVVYGTLEKTESGGLMVVTTRGWHKRETPILGEHVQWPE